MWLVNLAVYGSIFAAILQAVIDGEGAGLVLFVCAILAVTAETIKGFLPNVSE